MIEWKIHLRLCICYLYTGTGIAVNSVDKLEAYIVYHVDLLIFSAENERNKVHPLESKSNRLTDSTESNLES